MEALTTFKTITIKQCFPSFFKSLSPSRKLNNLFRSFKLYLNRFRKETDLSNVDNFEEMFEVVTKHLYHVLKKGKYIAVLIGNHWDKKAHKVIPHGITTYNILAKYFMPQEEVIKIIYGASSHIPLWDFRLRKSKDLLSEHEYLWIMKKPSLIDKKMTLQNTKCH